MGVNVELRLQGEVPRKGRVSTTVLDEVVDADDVFVGLLNKSYNSGRTPVLDRIDPYANVILSGRDVSRLVDELGKLRPYATSDAERRQLASIEALSRKCLTMGESCRLHFVGD